jgi:hypothetical protein
MMGLRADKMGMKVSGYTFEGPFNSTNELKNESGVYVILTEDGGNWKLLDCGETSSVKHEVEDHLRKDCWEKHAFGRIAYIAKYSEEKGRRMIVNEIRQEHSLPCGNL